MSLSITTLESLRVATELEVKESESYEKLCEILFEILLNSDRKDVKLSESNEIIAKSVWLCAIEAAQLRMEIDQLENQLKKFDHPLILSILHCYKRYKDSLCAEIQTIGWTYPRIIDIDWQISGLMETNSEERIKEPLIEMIFKSLSADSTSTSPDAFKFCCTKNQLLELRWKVKEAQNMLQKLSNS